MFSIFGVTTVMYPLDRERLMIVLWTADPWSSLDLIINGMVHLDDLVVYLFGLGGKGLWCDPQLGNDVDKGIDTPLQLEEFVEHYHLFLLKDTVSALEVASLIANDVLRLVQHSLDLIQGRLCILHWM